MIPFFFSIKNCLWKIFDKYPICGVESFTCDLLRWIGFGRNVIFQSDSSLILFNLSHIQRLLIGIHSNGSLLHMRGTTYFVVIGTHCVQSGWYANHKCRHKFLNNLIFKSDKYQVRIESHIQYITQTPYIWSLRAARLGCRSYEISGTNVIQFESEMTARHCLLILYLAYWSQWYSPNNIDHLQHLVINGAWLWWWFSTNGTVDQRPCHRGRGMSEAKCQTITNWIWSETNLITGTNWLPVDIEGKMQGSLTDTVLYIEVKILF